MSQEESSNSNITISKIVCVVCNKEVYSNNLKHECELRKSGNVKIKSTR